jgi:cold-inducible RNA-binding protein
MSSLYVGNLSFDTTEDDLQRAFSEYGRVSEVNLVKDRETGRSRGFAFVEMPDGGEAAKAMQAMNLSQMGDRSITVNPARPRAERPRGGGYRR